MFPVCTVNKLSVSLFFFNLSSAVCTWLIYGLLKYQNNEVLLFLIDLFWHREEKKKKQLLGASKAGSAYVSEYVV